MNEAESSEHGDGRPSGATPFGGYGADMVELAPNLKVSPMGFGCMGMTAFYGPAMKTKEGIELLRSVYDAGYTHFDTAEVYTADWYALPVTCKYNEQLVGEFVSTLPDGSFSVATKFFPRLHDYRCDYETVSAAVDASLARLKVERVDVYYLHRMPGSVEALEEWMASMRRVVETGRVRHVGLSEAPGEWIRRAHRIHPVSCVQQEWSLLSRMACETEVVPVCIELNIGLVAYSPLGRNILGQPNEPPTDWRADHPRWNRENFEKNMRLVGRVAELAQAKGLTAAQLSLAWLVQKAQRLGVTCLPIPGTRNPAHALDNLAALSAPKLSDTEMERLEALGATVAGKRGNEKYMLDTVEGLSSISYTSDM